MMIMGTATEVLQDSGEPPTALRPELHLFGYTVPAWRSRPAPVPSASELAAQYGVNHAAWAAMSAAASHLGCLRDSLFVLLMTAAG
jgi:hypothetical protein